MHAVAVRAVLRAVALRGRPLRVLPLLSFVVPSVLAPAPLAAQDGAPGEESRLVEGQVLRATTREPRPVGGLWVVLHRVGSDWSGPLDSARTGADGRYRLSYQAVDTATAIYFVSADYSGIAYFSAPLREPVVRGEAAELYVFDTTSAPVPVRVLGRHLIVTAPRADGHREIVEVYELANDSTVTRVSGGSDAPTFAAILPASAAGFQPGQGDFSPGALLMQDGRMMSHAPIAPGLKQISFSYVLPPGAFPVSIPVERDVDVMEVLLEEPGATASATGLVEVNPVTIEQRPFRRLLAQQLPANAVLTIGAPPLVRRPLGRMHIPLLAIAIGGIMTAALLLALRARRERAAVVASPSHVSDRIPPSPEPLARAIAELDEQFERSGARDESERQRYLARRAELKQQLADALAGQERDT